MHFDPQVPWNQEVSEITSDSSTHKDGKHQHFQPMQPVSKFVQVPATSYSFHWKTVEFQLLVDPEFLASPKRGVFSCWGTATHFLGPASDPRDRHKRVAQTSGLSDVRGWVHPTLVGRRSMLISHP